MAKETTHQKSDRLKKLIAILRKTYPNARVELNYSNPLELLVATILSAQCTDKRVNMVTAALFKKYRSAADYAHADLAELEQEIKSTGFYRNKARTLKALGQQLIERHGGQVPNSMEELTGLPGVGRKTANVLLGNAFGINAGIVVDTHVTRLAQRLGLTAQKDPEKIEQDLMQLVPRELWTDFAHWLIWHGRRRCIARKPDCENCEVNQLCPRIGVQTEAHADVSAKVHVRSTRQC